MGRDGHRGAVRGGDGVAVEGPEALVDHELGGGVGVGETTKSPRGPFPMASRSFKMIKNYFLVLNNDYKCVTMFACQHWKIGRAHV